jgi:hypothetical protein
LVKSWVWALGSKTCCSILRRTWEESRKVLWWFCREWRVYHRKWTKSYGPTGRKLINSCLKNCTIPHNWPTSR